jgi:hypothetical protein
MRRLIASLLFGAVIGLPAAAHAASCEPVTADDALAAEDARYAAQVGEDFIAMEQLLADDLIYIHSSTVIDSKRSYIDSLQSRAVTYLSMKRSDVSVRILGCVAVITGLGNFDVRLNGKELSVEVRFHSLWARRDGRLQFASWQATRTPPK